jgi:carbonic anhydrase
MTGPLDPEPPVEVPVLPESPDEGPGTPGRVDEPTGINPGATTQLLLENATQFAQSSPAAELAAAPQMKLAIVTCMDCRIDPAALFGFAPGDVHVLRNAGGVISEDMIRSLSISQHKLGTEEVMVIHHTRCGMQTITDDGFRAELQELTGIAPSFAIESFADLDADVRQSIRRVRSSPFIPHRDHVRGFVYDVDDHTLREVAPD